MIAIRWSACYLTAISTLVVGVLHATHGELTHAVGFMLVGSLATLVLGSD